MTKLTLRIAAANALFALALLAWPGALPVAAAMEEAEASEPVDVEAQALSEAIALMARPDWDTALEKAETAGAGNPPP